MSRSTLTKRVLSGIACLALAAVGYFQYGVNDSPMIRDGHAPRTTATPAGHLDEMKMTNPILSSLQL